MKVSTETNGELKRGSKIEGVELPPLIKGATKYPTRECISCRIKKWVEEITQNFCGEVHCALALELCCFSRGVFVTVSKE